MLECVSVKVNSFFYDVLKPAIKVPLCYTAKLYFLVKKRNLRINELKNIIILTSPQNGLGDNIMFSYYIHDLLNNRKDLKLYIVSPYNNFWKLLDYENLHIIYTPKSTMGLYKTLRNINNLFDLAILPSPYIQHIYALFLVNANHKVCYDPLDLVLGKSRLDILGTSNMENCKAYDLYNSFYGELLGNLLKCCGFYVEEKIPKLKYISDDKLYSRKTVVVFAYSKDKLREIPVYFWINLCYNLIQSGYKVLILYDDEAKAYSQKLLNSAKVSGIYTDSIEKTIKILNSAYAVICPDGGFMHISFLSKVEKIVVLFNVVESKHRIPQIVYVNKKIKTIQIESPKLKNILSTISSSYKSFFEYKPKLTELYIKEYRREMERIIKENEKEYINEILKFLKCAE
jgi:ADP-heptose:LPS heptosyltransferase